MRRRQMTTEMVHSPTRTRFLAKKRQKRETRARDAWLEAHTFYCTGQRRRRGQMRACLFEVRFNHQVEGAKATCSFCHTAHVYSSAGTERSRWMTQSEYAEVHIPEESLLRIEDVYVEVEAEKKVPPGSPIVKEKIIVADHAPWCHKPDVILAGLSAKMGAPGRVRWTDRGGRVRHLCQSSEAARRLANARWANAS